jgi:multidrug resistance efflux pump
MKTTITIAIVLGALVGIGGRLLLHTDAEPVPPAGTAGVSGMEDQVAANGVVEGARPEVALRPEAAGTLRVLNVRENDHVSQGAVLAEISNEAQKQQVALARAEVAVARRQLERLRNGARPEERKAAAAVEAAKRALYRQAEADYRRTEKLGSGTVSQQQRDTDYFKMLSLKAEWEQAKASLDLIEAPPRAEDVAVAESQVEAAEARLRLAEAELAKTRLVAPTDGRVLQVISEVGEMVSPTQAQPVLIVADLSKCRVRAFVEELDFARIETGQEATVTADGLPGKTFPGKVALILARMGKRAPQSDAPSEYKDVHYREVLIDLDDAVDLPVSLRVQVQIHVRPGGGP